MNVDLGNTNTEYQCLFNKVNRIFNIIKLHHVNTSDVPQVMTNRWWRFLLDLFFFQRSYFQCERKILNFRPFACIFQRNYSPRRGNWSQVCKLPQQITWVRSKACLLLVRMWIFQICHLKAPLSLVALNGPTVVLVSGVGAGKQGWFSDIKRHSN